MMQRPAIRVLTVLIALCGLASWVACGPEVGSDAWCEKMLD